MSASVSSCPSHWNKTVNFHHYCKWLVLRVFLVFLLRTVFVHAPGQGTMQELFPSKSKGEPYVLRVVRAAYNSSLGETQIPFIQCTSENVFFPREIVIREVHCLSPSSKMGFHNLLEHSAWICIQCGHKRGYFSNLVHKGQLYTENHISLSRG